MGAAFGSLAADLWRAKLTEFGVPDREQQARQRAGLTAFMDSAQNVGHPGDLNQDEQGRLIQGPPTPGRTQTIGAQQREQIQAVAGFDLAGAFKIARETQALNRAEMIRQDNLRDTWEDNRVNRENLEISQGNAKRAEAQWQNTKALQDIEAGKTPIQRQIESLQDKGQDAVLDDGIVKYRPLFGTDEFQEDVSDVEESRSTVNTLNELMRKIALGIPLDPNAIDNATATALVEVARTDRRIGTELGALTGPDMEVLARQIADPTELRALLLRSGPAFIAALQVIQENEATKLAFNYSQISHYQLDPNTRVSFLSAIDSAPDVREQTMQFSQQREEAIRALNVVREPTGVQGILSELGLNQEQEELDRKARLKILRDFEASTGRELTIPHLGAGPVLDDQTLRILGNSGLGDFGFGLGAGVGVTQLGKLLGRFK